MTIDTLISLSAFVALLFLVGKGSALMPRRPGWRRRGTELILIALESAMLALTFANTSALRFAPAGTRWRAFAFVDDINLLLSLNVRPYLVIDWSVALRLAATLFVIGTVLAACQRTEHFRLTLQQTQAHRGSRARRWLVVGGWVAVAVLIVLQTSGENQLVTLLFWALVVSLILVPRVVDERALSGSAPAPATIFKRALARSPYAATFLIVAAGTNVAYWNTALKHPFGAFLLAGLAWYVFSATLLRMDRGVLGDHTGSVPGDSNA